ncbi:MAG TPA: YezD family protein [Nitrospirota bacterium]
MNDAEASHRHNHQEIEQAILRALRGLRFGSIEIIVHDSKVVQIERKEKTRFDGTVSRMIR